MLRPRLTKLVPVCASCRKKLPADAPNYWDNNLTNLLRKICENCQILSFSPTNNIITGNKIFRAHIDLFNDTLTISKTKNRNDENNKIREHIICALINNQIDASFYEDEKWSVLKKQQDEFLYKLNGERRVFKSQCEQKGGRKYKYDFDISLWDADDTSPKMFRVEFKFNAKTIQDAPQFVSPSNPGKFLEYNYAEYFYDHYLPALAEKAGLPIPPKPEYLAQIHGDKPECMQAFQHKYYSGCKESRQCSHSPEDAAFYFAAKKIADESIREFIAKYDLDIHKLSEYLTTGQTGKIYMLYSSKNGFAMETPNTQDFILVSCEKKGNKYVCVCANGHKLTVLLRWKNGNGIAFPAFQLSVSR